MNRKYNFVMEEALALYIKHFYAILGYSTVFLLLFYSYNYKTFDLLSGDLSYVYLGMDSSFLYAVICVFIATIVQSFFTTVLIFLIRRDLQSGYDKTHVSDIIKDLFWQLLIISLIINFLMFAVFVFSSTIGFYFAPLFYILIALVTLFTNQSIVVDERGPLRAIERSMHFIENHPKHFVFVLLLGSIISAILGLIAYFVPGGYIISLILYQIGFVPYIEIVKTYLYMTKFRISSAQF